MEDRVAKASTLFIIWSLFSIKVDPRWSRDALIRQHYEQITKYSSLHDDKSQHSFPFAGIVMGRNCVQREKRRNPKIFAIIFHLSVFHLSTRLVRPRRGSLATVASLKQIRILLLSRQRRAGTFWSGG